MEFELKAVKGFILSPGNIFWKQKSGKLVQLCTKSGFLNLELIEKLFHSNHELLIENQLDLQLQADFCQYFKNHKLEVLVKEKKKWRSKLMSLFSGPLAREEVGQVEIDQLAWKVFSSVDQDFAQQLLDEDIELFKRGMSIASSYTLCAFMLGHYDDSFLSKLYTDTFLSLMDLNKIAPTPSLKMELERIRTKESWENEDRSLLSNIYKLDDKKKLLIGERFDGTGVQQMNSGEMTDLDMVLIALNEHYAYIGNLDKNIFYEIKNSYFRCNEKILKVFNKCLEDNRQDLSEMSA